MNRLTRIAVAVGATTLLATTAACGATSGSTKNPAAGETPGKKTGKITIALLQKQGDQQYFVDEAKGAKDAAAELGDVEIKVVDLGTDANKAIAQLDAVIAQKVDAIMIVVPDQQIGPQVIDKAKAAGIPLIASDDAIKDASGAAAPFVGFDGRSMGNSVGKKAAELYRANGWKASETRVIAAWKKDLQTCTDRVDGAAEAFKSEAGELPEVIEIGTDNSVTDAQNKAGAVLTANQGVKHWLVWGCNDENETGVVTALQNGKVAPADIIGVGLGAYLTCKDWKAKQDTGNKAALYIGGPAVGSAGVKILVENLRNAAPLPPTTIAETQIVDKDNWEQSGLVCT